MVTALLVKVDLFILMLIINGVIQQDEHLKDSFFCMVVKLDVSLQSDQQEGNDLLLVDYFAKTWTHI